MNAITTKREPKREPRGYVLPGSASVGLGTLGHRRTSSGGKRAVQPPIPIFASILNCLILKAFCESSRATRTQMRTRASSGL